MPIKTRLVFAFIFSLMSVLARAQDVSVEATLEPERAYLGSTFTYTISIQTKSEHKLSEPELDLPAGISLVGTSTAMRTSSGPVLQPDGSYRMQTLISRDYVYTLAASHVGEFTIPPATVTLDNQQYKTEAVHVTIVEPEPIEGFKLEAHLSKPRVYAGEPFTLYLTWYVGGDVRDFALAGGELPAGITAEPISDPGAGSMRSRYIQTSIYGQTIFGKRGEGTLDGKRVTTLSFEIQFLPKQAGSFSLGPIVMIFDANEGRSTRRGMSQTDPIPLEVLPLPTQGRPPGFNGLIGKYSIDATATPVEVSVGDPISLDVDITGPDARQVTDGPDLAAQPQFANDFKLDPAGWERQQGTFTDAIYRTTIRALDQKLTEIPAIALPYFDPDAGEYKVATSDPIQLTVRPSHNVTLEDAVTSSVLPPAARTELGKASAGLWSIAPESILAASQPPSPELDWMLPVLIVPPLIWFAALVADALRDRSRRPRAVSRRAFRRACALARRGRPDAAVRLYVANALGQLPEAVTAEDCRHVVADADIASGLAACVSSDESARFGGQSASPPPPDELVELLRRTYAAREVSA